MAENSKYRECGGCGAQTPKERCIGCLHVFFTGDWPENLYKNDKKHGPTEKDEEMQRYTETY